MTLLETGRKPSNSNSNNVKMKKRKKVSEKYVEQGDQEKVQSMKGEKKVLKFVGKKMFALKMKNKIWQLRSK